MRSLPLPILLARSFPVTTDALSASLLPIAPPNAKVHAGYMILQNNGNEKLVIKTVSSPQYRKCELHKTEIKNGIASMEHLPNLEIPANGKIVLSPGGLHIMLFGPKRLFVENDMVPIIFHLENGKLIKSMAKITKRLYKSHTH